MTTVQHRIAAEAFFAGHGWVDVSGLVYERDDVVITRGGRNSTLGVTPGSCDLTFNGRGGELVPLNPNSPYYDDLGQNTPLRIAVVLQVDTFGRVVATGWASTDDGLAYSTLSAGGVISASDYSVAAGVGSHSVPAAAATRTTYLPDLVIRDVTVAVTVTSAVSNVTGAAIELGNLLFRGQGAGTDAYVLYLAVTTAEAVTLTWHTLSGGAISTTATVAGLTYAAATPLRVVGQVEGQTLRAKVWPAGDPEPHGWQVTWVDQVDPILDAGWVGVRTGAATGNTNAKPVVATYEDLVISSPRSYTELADLTPAWDTSGNDVTVKAHGAGILERLAQDSALQDALTRWYPRDGITAYGECQVVAFWPMTDPQDTSGYALAPLIGRHHLVLATTRPGTDHFARGTLASWLSPVLALHGGDQVAGLVDMPDGWVNTDGWMVDGMRAGGSGSDTRLVIACGQLLDNGRSATQLWIIDYLASTSQIRVTLPGGTTSTTSSGTLYSGPGHHARFMAHQQGADIVWALEIEDTAITMGAVLAGATLLGVVQVAGLDLTAHSEPFAWGYWAVYAREYATSAPNAYTASRGHHGERAGRRAQRLAGEEGVEFCWTGQLDETAPMGPQTGKKLLDLQVECVDADRGGMLTEARGSGALHMITLRALFNLDPTLTLDLPSGHVTSGGRPRLESRGTVNQVTAVNELGMTAFAEQTTGRRSVQPPGAGGVGPYPKRVPANVAGVAELADVAGFAVRVGTVDEYRYPQLGTHLTKLRAAGAGGPQLERDALDMDMGRALALTTPKSVLPPADVRQLPVGYTERLHQMRHEITWVGTPASPFQAIRLGAANNKLGSRTAVLDAGITTTATTFDVADPVETWGTGGAAIVLDVGGEEMTVVSIAAPAGGVQAFTVARSTNDVVKAHPAGTPVRLARRATFTP
ncbi:MAG TPA: hypothetical protein VGD67_12100 [Pseudonocardiaceae bacterium]